MKEILELETRKHIYVLVSKQPGINLSTIAEVLKISVPLSLYHLRYLEKHGLITSTKEDGSIRYYIKGKIGVKDKKYLSLFRQEISLRIILFLLQHPYSRYKDILENFNMSSSLFSYHLMALVKKGIIEVREYDNEHGYVVIDEAEIIQFLIKYEPYKIFKGLSDTWADFTMR